MYPSSRAVEVFAPDRRPEKEIAAHNAQGLAVRLPTILKQTEVLIFSPGGRLSCLPRAGGRVYAAPRGCAGVGAALPLVGARGVWLGELFFAARRRRW
jgi:hypothetical protein